MESWVRDVKMDWSFFSSATKDELQQQRQQEFIWENKDDQVVDQNENEIIHLAIRKNADQTKSEFLICSLKDDSPRNCVDLIFWSNFKHNVSIQFRAIWDQLCTIEAISADRIAFRLSIPTTNRIPLSEHLNGLQTYMSSLSLSCKEIKNDEKKVYDDEIDGDMIRLDLVVQICALMKTVNEWCQNQNTLYNVSYNVDPSLFYVCQREGGRLFYPIHKRSSHDTHERKRTLPKLKLREPTLSKLVFYKKGINRINFRYFPMEDLLNVREKDDKENEETKTKRDLQRRKFEKSNVYSLACLIIYVLTGCEPWQGHDFENVRKLLVSSTLVNTRTRNNHSLEKKQEQKQEEKWEKYEQEVFDIFGSSDYEKRTDVFTSFQISGGRNKLDALLGKLITDKLLECLSPHLESRPSLSSIVYLISTRILHYDFNRPLSTKLLRQELSLCTPSSTVHRILQQLKQNEYFVDHRYPLFDFSQDHQNEHIVHLIKRGILDLRKEPDVLVDHCVSPQHCIDEILSSTYPTFLLRDLLGVIVSYIRVFGTFFWTRIH
jgi:hypothetical protein